MDLSALQNLDTGLLAVIIMAQGFYHYKSGKIWDAINLIQTDIAVLKTDIENIEHNMEKRKDA